MKIRIKKLHAEAILPHYAHGPDEDAGLDLRAVERVVLSPGVSQGVPTGLAIELPPGYEAQVRPRSGMALKHSVTCNFGTIDPGYRGEIRVIMFNLGKSDYVVEQGDRGSGWMRNAVMRFRARRRRVRKLRTLTARLACQLAGQWPALTRVLIAGLLSIGDRHARRELFEGERADPHARVQRYRHPPQIAQLERGLSRPARIKQSSSAVHDNADAAEAGAALQAPQYIVVQLQRFFGDRQREFARLQDERLAMRHGYGAHQILNRGPFLQVDERMPAVLKHAELAPQAKIDRAAPQLLRRQRGRDLDLALLDVPLNIDVGKNHFLMIEEAGGR